MKVETNIIFEVNVRATSFPAQQLLQVRIAKYIDRIRKMETK